jgi:uncharacterized membrane protein YjgN (DUF898 family)
MGVVTAFAVPAILRLFGMDMAGELSRKILGIVMTLAVYVVLVPVILGYTKARNLNEVINHTKVGPHRLHSSLKARKLIGIYFTNVLMMIATLGLYTPWAQIRLARYQLGVMEIEPQGSLDEITSSGMAHIPTATGEEVSSFLDVDFGF